MKKQRKKKILIIDDEPDLLEMISQRLEFEGFEIDSALSGPEGLKKSALFRPDVILLDVKMSGMDGWEVCRQLRANPQMAKTKIIMLTAIRSVKEAKEAGADLVVLKPCNIDELTAILLNPNRRQDY